ncbi:hypothetical protein WJX82_003459 [Trebouxia sp. C0006]
MSNAFSDKLPIEKPQDCVSRVISGTTSSFVAGGIIGALTANWGDIPQVLQDKPLPALKRTGAIMGSYGLTFAAIGLAYSGIDCVAETFRGKKDVWNGVFGGAAAGAMLGLRLGKLPVDARVTTLRLGSSKTLHKSPNLGLPSSWSSLSQLSSFSYDDTSGGTPRLTGKLPASWGTMTNITNFMVYSASLSGPLPDAWNGMLNLRELTSDTSSINSTPWRQTTQLTEVVVSNSQLTGTLPASWAALTSLSNLASSNNNLNGSLPMEWGNMTQLSQVNLSYNNLSGSVPESWGGLSHLRYIDLIRGVFDCPEALINTGVAKRGIPF